jgi:uncharacterized membrane protein YccF (DUF307 family)
MLKILQFIFCDFWHWLGFSMLLLVCITPILTLIEAKYNSKNGEEDK